jgi:hypothetical protein
VRAVVDQDSATCDRTVAAPAGLPVRRADSWPESVDGDLDPSQPTDACRRAPFAQGVQDRSEEVVVPRIDDAGLSARQVDQPTAVGRVEEDGLLAEDMRAAQ